ncbi:uncharacterized protein V2V93DRAFT_362088 [Kockiozyma suomiensis]|uniref:uncharacterized protein n=1 Tax=Kockiozyma suomiensis TaxID=1337062 RepID=UPI003343B265
MAVRPTHIARAKELIQQGVIISGGAITSSYFDPTVEGAKPDIIGSLIIMDAESLDKVWEIIKSDAYAAEVWDFEASKINHVRLRWILFSVPTFLPVRANINHYLVYSYLNSVHVSTHMSS